MKNTYFIFLAVLLLASCQPDASNTDKDQPPAEVVTDTQEPVSTNETNRYLNLKGTVGDYPITMNLQINLAGGELGWNYSGTYYYDNVGEPLTLQGMAPENSTIELDEYNRPGEITGKFVGRINAKNEFTGSWRSGDNKKELEFSLRPTAQISFRLLPFSDSLAWQVPGTEGATAYYDETWLWPATDLPAAQRNFLTQQIMIQMAGDSLAAIYHDPQSLYSVQKDLFFKDFSTEMQAIIDDNGGEEPAWLPPGYSSSTSMEIAYNSTDLLTIAYLGFSYMGGAHGNYGTDFKVYDLSQQKVLTLEDIFKPGYEATLNQALEAALRKSYEIQEGQGLSEILFEDKIEANTNFGLTDHGIIFNYVPYEISAYAVGEIRLYVPFKALKEVLKAPYIK